MKAGRELDALVAEKVMGWKDPWQPFFPSTEIADAFEVLKALKTKGIQAEISTRDFSVCLYRLVNLSEMSPYEFKTYLVRIDDVLSFDEIPLAICLAALKAVGVEVDE